MRLLLFLYFFKKGFSLAEAGLGCGSGNSATVPSSSEATQPLPHAGARRLPGSCFNRLLCQAGSLGRLPGGIGMDLCTADAREASKLRPRGLPCTGSAAASLPQLQPRELPCVLGRTSPCSRLSLGIGVSVAAAQRTDVVGAFLATPQHPSCCLHSHPTRDRRTRPWL